MPVSSFWGAFDLVTVTPLTRTLAPAVSCHCPGPNFSGGSQRPVRVSFGDGERAALAETEQLLGPVQAARSAEIGAAVLMDHRDAYLRLAESRRG